MYIGLVAEKYVRMSNKTTKIESPTQEHKIPFTKW